MKLVKCIDSKHYNLTEGKEYEANESFRDGRYLIVNDNNIAVNYSTALFEDVVEEVRDLTDEEILESLVFVTDKYNDEIVVKYKKTTADEVSEFTIDEFKSESTHISCGIGQLYNLNGVVYAIEDKAKEMSDAFKSTVLKEVTKRFITDLVSYRAFYLLSTAIGDIDEIYHDVLKELSIGTYEAENPNSGNDIILYIIDVESLN